MSRYKSICSRAHLGRALAFAALVLAPAFTILVAQDAPAATEVRVSAVAAGPKHGREIFNQRCVVCHNKQPSDTSPFGPPNLFLVFKNKTITTAQAEAIITKGNGQMPPFGSLLKKSDMESVIAYLRSVK